MPKKRLTKINSGLPKGNPFYNVALDIQNLPKQKPTISITFMDAGKELKKFADYARKQQGEKDVYKQFEDFLVKVRQFNSIEEVISYFSPKKSIKNSDSESRAKMQELQKNFNIDTSDMVHIHCCGGGSGQMVLHGFVIHSSFEIVWIDPGHTRHRLS